MVRFALPEMTLSWNFLLHVSMKAGDSILIRASSIEAVKAAFPSSSGHNVTAIHHPVAREIIDNQHLKWKKQTLNVSPQLNSRPSGSEDVEIIHTGEINDYSKRSG